MSHRVPEEHKFCMVAEHQETCQHQEVRTCSSVDVSFVFRLALPIDMLSVCLTAHFSVSFLHFLISYFLFPHLLISSFLISSFLIPCFITTLRTHLAKSRVLMLGLSVTTLTSRPSSARRLKHLILARCVLNNTYRRKQSKKSYQKRLVCGLHSWTSTKRRTFILILPGSGVQNGFSYRY